MPRAASPQILAALIDVVADPETHAARAAELETKRTEAAEFKRFGQAALDRAGEMDAALDRRKAEIDAAEALLAEREAKVERREGEVEAREAQFEARELAMTTREEVVQQRILDALQGYRAIKRLFVTALDELEKD